MRLTRFEHANGDVGFGAIAGGRIQLFSGPRTLAELLAAPDPLALSQRLLNDSKESLTLETARLLAPIDRQEVWAAGVTYIRSKIAREEESAGAAHFYDKVYAAHRPELFMKAPAWRVVGPERAVRIRRDSKWNVPEPELALVISPALKIVGYTIGNDMSSRDIEGENPLYLPQAKIYNGSCSLGPCITLAEAMPPLDQVEIRMAVARGGKPVFEGSTSLGRMARTPQSLVDWLGKEMEFPDGCILLTGTGIVPPDDFSLAWGDQISIDISGIGTLKNFVGQP